MSTIRHYQVVPGAMGPLSLLENIAEVSDRQVAKTCKSSYLLTSSVSVTVRQASTITAGAITIQSQKKYHNSPGIALTTYRSQGTRNGRRIPEPHVLVCLPIYAIFLNKTVTSSAGSN